MESLLAPSFANLSSRDTSRIRKGIRQIEGLLAQICLSSNKLSPHKRKSSVIPNGQEHSPCKQLKELRKDAAFREFFRLQEGFEWNVANRLMTTLERLLGMQSSPQINHLILSTLDLLQGTLLLHPPSRTLFAREDYMTLTLDLLDAPNTPAIQSQALLVLVTALLDRPANTRTFEATNGLETVTSLVKRKGTNQEVRMKATEFLYFYLMPEALPTASSSAPNTAVGLQRSPSKLQVVAGRSRTHSGSGDGGGDSMDVDEDGVRVTKTTEEKQKLLGRHVNNVAELVRDLSEMAIFNMAEDGGH